MRALVVRLAAQADLVSAVRWYVDQRPSLGSSFRLAVRVQRFPYRVFFIAESERLVVIAVLHVRRAPVVFAAAVVRTLSGNAGRARITKIRDQTTRNLSFGEGHRPEPAYPVDSRPPRAARL